jgi:hypothetical protein
MEADDPTPTPRPTTFWQRHALTIMMGVMGALLVLVIVIQMVT